MLNLGRSARRAGAVTAIAAVGIIASGAPALALNNYRYWYSSSSPLKVYDGGVAQGGAYGNWRLTYVSGSLKSVASGYVKDYKVGGASVYFELRTQTNSGICVTPPYTSCSQSWYTHAYDDSAHSNSDAWVSTSASTGVRDSSDGARGTVRTCEEVRYVPDTCSGWWYSTPDTYA